jgi:ribosomal protein L32E
LATLGGGEVWRNREEPQSELNEEIQKARMKDMVSYNTQSRILGFHVCGYEEIPFPRMWRCVDLERTNISEEHVASIFRVEGVCR